MAAPLSTLRCVLASCLILRLSSAASVYMLITCFLLLLPLPPFSLSLSSFFLAFLFSSSVYSYCCLCSCRHLINLTCCEFICPIHCCSFLSFSVSVSFSLSRPRTEQICCNFLLQLRLQICALHEKRYKSCHSKKNIEEGQERV